MLWEAVAGRRFWSDAGDGQVVQQLMQGQLRLFPAGNNPSQLRARPPRPAVDAGARRRRRLSPTI